MTDPDEFNVVVFNRDDRSLYILRGVDARKAVETAKQLTDDIQNKRHYVRDVRKVMITDGGDCANFLWEVGKGIIYPTSKEGLKL